MNGVKSLFLLCAALIMGGMYSATVQAAPLNDAHALRGVHTAKAVFLINVKSPNALAHVLKVVGLTETGMVKQGVKTRLVVVVIGHGVAFLTKDMRGIPYTERAAVAHAQKAVRMLDHMGVRFEACGVALKFGVDIPPSDIMAGVHPVGNGFISAIGYQAQGYQLVPVF
ncbi:MAG TPA: DsrE family protein [Acidiferrobacter sp.]|nr:DsrE family protein [Acidiferrobacter sp.]